jgi:DnaD/phage-associated family protein
MTFDGFSSDEAFIPVPERFFREVLPEIADADELRVILYAFWRDARMEGEIRFFRRETLEEELGAGYADGLEKAVRRGILLQSTRGTEEIFLLNTPRGRAAAEAFQSGQWSPSRAPKSLPPSPPNLFRLYEENIGPLTPLVADRLKDAEKTYPAEWIAEAVSIAVVQNKRNWAYVEAILKRWKEEGYAKKQTRRDSKENRRRYIEGDFADFIEH